MAKKKEMTPQEQKLYNDLKKLAKRANQRLVRLERLTGEKGTFASKQLYDYLDSSELQALSKAGRIRVSKDFSFTQLKAIIKATNQFLESPVSLTRGVKKKTKEYSEKAEKPISYKQANVLYKSGKNYTWIYEYMTKSEFWAFVKLAREQGWNKKTFIDQIEGYISREVDEELRADLEALYIYVME
jgi:hypothetical protein